jgi:predicted  nucleic acid-binding Zn-ribbon protein
MSERSDTPESVRKFAPKRKLRNDSHPTDQAGEALIAMLQEAAKLSNENRERLMDFVHDLSKQLQAAQDRINQLQYDVEHFRGRAAGAEKWLELIQKEIEETLISPMAAMWREQTPSH